MVRGVRIPRFVSRVVLPCVVASVAVISFLHPVPNLASSLAFSRTLNPQSSSNLDQSDKRSQLVQHHQEHQPHQQRAQPRLVHADEHNMASRASLRVLISGGGIAGNALAFWLTKLGHNVTVVERFPGLRATGLQLDLRGAGIEVMRRMGLEQAFQAKRAPEEGMQVVDSTGRQRAWFPASKPKVGERQGFTTEFELMRGDICRILHHAAAASTTPAGALKTSARYVFGTAVESFEQHADAVDVRFEDGTTASFDLLVGADGQWSRTRRMLLAAGGAGGHAKTSKASSSAAAAVAPESEGLYLIPGLYFTYFTMRKPIEEGEGYIATSYMAPHRRGIMTRRHSPNELQVMLSCRNDSQELRDIRRGDVEKEKEAIAGIFKDAGWQAEAILKAMKEAPDFYCERLGLVKVAPWSRGRVALIGDAAHCPTVLTGMGTTSAMVGAYVLAGEISRHVGKVGNGEGDGDNHSDGLATALESYETRFRPFVDQVQKGVLEHSADKWMMADTSMQVAFMNWMMGVASFFAKRVNIVDAFGIRETVKGWDLPRYEGLEKTEE
ncbi:hypothetical protein KVR01_006028 [Diaporthe batatas]|uniref:uncharacterized protein n=1 Tax=Diaporthe batatas TaxID=748121 RepID=UPI001D0499E0|nr:uncharacterized protein KVR01_006028 [Diaporthe batatas]KAG8164110.1 hypothetical protein KVR01_006028 [Diaporthe batatas]